MYKVFEMSFFRVLLLVSILTIIKRGKKMDILVLKFLHSFASNKLNQTRCIDPFIWSRIFDYTGQEIKKFSKLAEVKK